MYPRQLSVCPPHKFNVIGVKARNRREIAQQLSMLHLLFLAPCLAYSSCFAIMHRLVSRHGFALRCVGLPVLLSSLPRLRHV